MTNQEISVIRLKALGPATRTDCSELILMELANGGFGPGYGLLGIGGDKVDDDGRTLTELRRLILSAEEFKLPIIPLCDWGGGAWSMIDCYTGNILTCSELGLKELGVKFNAWILQWAEGKNWWPEMFRFEIIEVTDPKTKRRAQISKFEEEK